MAMLLDVHFPLVMVVFFFFPFLEVGPEDWTKLSPSNRKWSSAGFRKSWDVIVARGYMFRVTEKARQHVFVFLSVYCSGSHVFRLPLIAVLPRCRTSADPCADSQLLGCFHISLCVVVNMPDRSVSPPQSLNWGFVLPIWFLGGLTYICFFKAD